MKKFLPILLLSLLTVSPSFAAPLSIWGRADRMIFKVLFPYTDPDTGKTWDAGGTAFCSPGQTSVLITAAHVVEDAPRTNLSVFDTHGQRHNGKVVAYNREKDVASIWLDDEACSMAPAEWAKRVPNPGERVYAVGYGGMKPTPIITEGIISGVKGIETEQPNGVPAQLNILMGNSGCPVFDVEGRIVGMGDGYFKAGDIMDVIIPVDEIRKVIK